MRAAVVVPIAVQTWIERLVTRRAVWWSAVIIVAAHGYRGEMGENGGQRKIVRRELE